MWTRTSRTRHRRDRDLQGQDIDVLNSKAEMLRTCWTLRTGVGNEIFEDETSVMRDLQGRDIVVGVLIQNLVACRLQDDGGDD